MIQSIIDGIIKAIRTKYDRSFRIYTKSVEQGLNEPCFSVLCLNGNDTKGVGTRRNRMYLINIAYFPSSDEPIDECLNVMEDLYALLDIIDLGNSKIHGMEMSGLIVDGVLQFQVTFSYFLLAETDTDTGMNRLEVKTDGKEQ